MMKKENDLERWKVPQILDDPRYWDEEIFKPESRAWFQSRNEAQMIDNWNLIIDAIAVPGLAADGLEAKARAVAGRLPPEGVAAAIHAAALDLDDSIRPAMGMKLLEILDSIKAEEAWRQVRLEEEEYWRRRAEQQGCPF